MTMSAPSPSWNADQIVAHLRSLGSEENRAGMARYGIKIETRARHSNAVLRPLGRADEAQPRARAASSGRPASAKRSFFASFIDDRRRLTRDAGGRWAADFDSWDIVDHGVRPVLSTPTPGAELIAGFAADEREFVRRAGLRHDLLGGRAPKKEPDATFLGYLPLIERHASDARNFVKKAVNWALRQIGKRSLALHAPALELAERLAASSDKTARWIGKDAVKELTDAKTLERLAKKG